jgi:hypothetical protein
MTEAHKIRFFELVERYNRLGALLPGASDLDSDDIEQVATARLVIAEMPRRFASRECRTSRCSPMRRGTGLWALVRRSRR